VNVQKVVFISSLERSGSTLLDLTLGRAEKCVSFGEVARVLEPHEAGGLAAVLSRICTCGKTARDCPFWGAVLEAIVRQEQALSLGARYTIFLARVQEVYGPDAVAVDSSKFLLALDALHECARRGSVDLKPLFLVRDVRGWMSSSRKAARRRKEVPYRTLLTMAIRRHWKAYLRHNLLRAFPFWLPVEWYLRNRRIEGHLQRLGLAFQVVSYEELSSNTEATLREIHAYLGTAADVMADVPRAHLIRGNRMAQQANGRATIRYDATWRDDKWSRYEAQALPCVMKKNAEWVYGRRS
jgi:hypothetical protein